MWLINIKEISKTVERTKTEFRPLPLSPRTIKELPFQGAPDHSKLYLFQ